MICQIVVGLLIAGTAGEPQLSSVSSPNFEVRYQDGQTTPQEAKIVSEKAEAFYKKLAAYLGRDAGRKIVISLEGKRGDDGKHRWSYVDTDAGWLHLFRFPEDTYPYEAGLSHELVHAFRFDHLSKVERPSPAFVFLEEGIAEFLSNQLAPKKAVFPNYGYDLDVAAGQWTATGEDISLVTLLADQFKLRPKCIVQSYTLQPSFIRFVELELGREVLRRLAYATDIESEESFTPYLGDRFSVWAEKWRRWILKRFKVIQNHDRVGREWRTKTPVSEMYVCKKGVDY